jgi:hypothetical protein
LVGDMEIEGGTIGQRVPGSQCGMIFRSWFWTKLDTTMLVGIDLVLGVVVASSARLSPVFAPRETSDLALLIEQWRHQAMTLLRALFLESDAAGGSCAMLGAMMERLCLA